MERKLVRRNAKTVAVSISVEGAGVVIVVLKITNWLIQTASIFKRKATRYVR